MKYSSLGLLGAAFLGKEVQDRFEMSEEVTRRLVSDREYALQQIEDILRSVSKKGKQGMKSLKRSGATIRVRHRQCS